MKPRGATQAVRRFFRSLASLTKIRITFVATLSAAAGYLWNGAEVTWDFTYTVVGVLLLACGSAAFNHVQDADLDARMGRTAGRPIPSGRMRRSTALFLSGVMVLLGLAALSSISEQEITALVLGIVAVTWYNVVYYFLKRITAFAVVPGSLIGALPPAIGWVGAGGDPMHPACLLIAGFFFVWQIPHFWLLQLNRTAEYTGAGLPTLADHFERPQLNRITSIWIWATAAAGVLFPALAGHEMSVWIRLLMVVASGWLAVAAVKILKSDDVTKRPYIRAFAEINGYALAVIICLFVAAI